jgi:hypothetical protein
MRWLMLTLTLCLGVACGAAEKSGGQVVDVSGTVRYEDLEGGWWYISVSPTEHYTPINLSDEFKVPGMQVQATVAIRTDLAGFLPLPYVEIRQIHQVPGQ